MEEAIVVVGQCRRRRFWKDKEKREASHHRGIKTRHDWSERKRTLARKGKKKRGVAVILFVVVVVVIRT